MDLNSVDIQQLCINTIRFLSVDAVEKANSGHPGMPMGCAPAAHLLFSKILRHNPANPNWFDRDRFVLSAGHGSMLLYSILHLTGYEISLDDIKKFRQLNSITPGHPEYGLTPGIETTTGPLGQGFGNAVGLALASKITASKFNRPGFKIINSKVYALAGDGDLMEGISHEAASFAGHSKLDNLIVIYDSNNITIDGPLSVSMSDDTEMRFKAYNWNVFRVKDVNNLDELDSVVMAASTSKEKPSLVIVNTKIGYGSPGKANSSEAHGSPLGKQEAEKTKLNLKWPLTPEFIVPEEVYDYYSMVKKSGSIVEKSWIETLKEYSESYPKEYEDLLTIIENKKPAFKVDLPEFKVGESIATRAASGKILDGLCKSIPGMIGGSADLTPSNNTKAKEISSFSVDNRSGRYVHYGIREHAMGAIMNGLALYGGFIPYGGTFLVFSDYMRPAVRMAAIMKLQVVFVFTHDSIGLGEDGCTHQPVEQISALRAIPGLTVIRPADGNETYYAWKTAIEKTNGPTALILSRQNLKNLDRVTYSSAEGVLKGGYILKDSLKKPDIIFLATGSEVNLALSTAEKLEAENISVRVVSMPSFEIFESQTDEYKNEVLPKDVTNRISIEAGVAQPWYKYLGITGKAVSIERFGLSAPAEQLFEYFGFTESKIIETVKDMLG